MGQAQILKILWEDSDQEKIFYFLTGFANQFFANAVLEFFR